MDLTLIEKSELTKLSDKLQDIENALKKTQKTENDLNYMTTKDFHKMFGLSLVTQWKMRKAGKLPYRTIGRTIFYKLSEIETACKS